MLKNFLYIGTVMYSSLVFSQEKTKANNGTITNVSMSLIDKSNINNVDIIDLQEYIDNLYITSSKFYNKGALPTLENGQYGVVLIDGNGNKSYKNSSYFKGMNPNSIEKIEFNKSSETTALYGDFGEKFGKITIKLKK